jgi:hypothetical protein
MIAAHSPDIPNQARCERARVMCLIETRQYDKALEHAKRAKALEPGLSKCCLLRGQRDLRRESFASVCV